MEKFKDSKGDVLLEKDLVVNELRKIVSSIADVEVGEIIDDDNTALVTLKAKAYEYSISFPITFSNFVYPTMQEYGFTDEKLHKELSENVAKNIYDGVMAIILNGETDVTNNLVDNGYALNYSINKESEHMSDDEKMTNINVDKENIGDTIRDILKYHVDTFVKLNGTNPKKVMVLGMQENILDVFGLKNNANTDDEVQCEFDGTNLSVRSYEVHRNDNGLMYFASDDDTRPFVVRIMPQEDSDEFRIAVYKRMTAHVLYCKLFE